MKSYLAILIILTLLNFVFTTFSVVTGGSFNSFLVSIFISIVIIGLSVVGVFSNSSFYITLFLNILMCLVLGYIYLSIMDSNDAYAKIQEKSKVTQLEIVNIVLLRPEVVRYLKNIEAENLVTGYDITTYPGVKMPLVGGRSVIQFVGEGGSFANLPTRDVFVVSATDTVFSYTINMVDGSIIDSYNANTDSLHIDPKF